MGELRTSRRQRNAWGGSIAADPSAAMEWELGARVMNDLEAENMRFTALGAVTTRGNRAAAVAITRYPGVEFFEHLISVVGSPDTLYFCYDLTEEGHLLCTQVDPPLGENNNTVHIFMPEDVEDSTEWDKEAY